MDRFGGLQFDRAREARNMWAITDRELRSASPSWLKRLDRSSPLFSHLPCTDDIRQTDLGNCYLVAALLAIVERHPYYLNDILRDNGDNTVTVRLYNNRMLVNYIEVEKTIYVKTRHLVQAPWVYLIEKAYAALRMREQPLVMIEDQGAPVPNDIETAIKGGSARESFVRLLGRSAQIITIISERYQPDIDIAEVPTYVPFQNLVNLLTYDTSNPTIPVPHVALQAVFPANQNAQQNFLQQTNLNTSNFFSAYFAERRTLRNPTLIVRTEEQFPLLDSTTWQLLVNYITAYVPRKRGSPDYVPNQLHYYDKICEALRQGELVCVATAANIGRADATSASAKRIRGLVPNHAYQVINCYERAGLKFLLLRNTWKHYVRGYRINKDGRSLSAYGVSRYPDQIYPNSLIQRPIIDFAKSPHELFKEEGVFEMELSNLTKRFSDICLGRLPLTPLQSPPLAA